MITLIIVTCPGLNPQIRQSSQQSRKHDQPQGTFHSKIIIFWICHHRPLPGNPAAVLVRLLSAADRAKCVGSSLTERWKESKCFIEASSDDYILIMQTLLYPCSWKVAEVFCRCTPNLCQGVHRLSATRWTPHPRKDIPEISAILVDILCLYPVTARYWSLPTPQAQSSVQHEAERTRLVP